MRTGYFYSLIFAFLTSASIAVIAAPAVKPGTMAAPQSVEQSVQAQSAKVDLNGADAATLQRELSGIGKGKADAIVAYRESNGLRWTSCWRSRGSERRFSTGTVTSWK
jgi:competence protein ComEA